MTPRHTATESSWFPYGLRFTDLQVGRHRSSGGVIRHADLVLAGRINSTLAVRNVARPLPAGGGSVRPSLTEAIHIGVVSTVRIPRVGGVAATWGEAAALAAQGTLAAHAASRHLELQLGHLLVGGGTTGTSFRRRRLRCIRGGITPAAASHHSNHGNCRCQFLHSCQLLKLLSTNSRPKDPHWILYSKFVKYNKLYKYKQQIYLRKYSFLVQVVSFF